MRELVGLALVVFALLQLRPRPVTADVSTASMWFNPDAGRWEPLP